MKHVRSTIAAILFLASVISQGQLPAPAVHQFGMPINWSPYLSGSNSNEARSAFYILNSDSQWQTYWSRESGQPVGTAPRDIDWNSEQVIAIHLGERKSGGYSAYVASIQRTDPVNALITVYEKFPVQGQFVAQGVTHPYVIIKVKRTAARYRYTFQPDPASAMGGINYPGSGSIIIPGNAGGGGGSCNCSAGCTCGCGCGNTVNSGTPGDIIITGPVIVNNNGGGQR